MEKETSRRFIGKFDANNDPLYEGDVVETKYGRHCKIIWWDTPVFRGWDLVPFAHLDCQAPDKYDLWESYNLTLIDSVEPEPTAEQTNVCHCWRNAKKPNRAYCTGTKDLDFCSCKGDRSKCDFYADVRAKASGTFEDIRKATVAKLQRLGVLDENEAITVEYRNILMKK